MSFEKKLRAGAKEATGDDSIIDVAVMQPKGTSGATWAGAFAGAAAGGAATDGNSWGSSMGAAGGVAAGRLAVGLGKKLPPNITVAVTADKVYLLGMKSLYAHKNLTPMAQIDRSKLGVEVHQRGMVRTVVLEDLDTNAKFPLEVQRVSFFGGKALVELLMMSEEHHDEEPSEEEIDSHNE
jgi:hypothetical protein